MKYTIIWLFAIAVALVTISCEAHKEEVETTGLVCKVYSSTATEAANAFINPNQPEQRAPIAVNAEVTFAMLDGLWPYVAGSTLTLGPGTPVKWRNSPGGPYQVGILESPIMVRLN